jgi:ABC-type nitrate/sulfonate/bicarbonate transport system ATPase subunit
MQQLVRTLWKETGTTIVFVTHNIPEALYLGTRVIVLGQPARETSSGVLFELNVPDDSRAACGTVRSEEAQRLTALISSASVPRNGLQ